MDSVVSYQGSRFINFRSYDFSSAGHHRYRSISIEAYDVDDTECHDLGIIAGVIRSAEYRDDRVGGQVHGPYRIGTISPDAFVAHDIPTARWILDRWVTASGPLPAGLRSDLENEIHPLFGPAAVCYALPRPGTSAVNDRGDRHNGYFEFVIIDRVERTAHRLVASDD